MSVSGLFCVCFGEADCVWLVDRFVFRNVFGLALVLAFEDFLCSRVYLPINFGADFSWELWHFRILLEQFWHFRFLFLF